MFFWAFWDATGLFERMIKDMDQRMSSCFLEQVTQRPDIATKVVELSPTAEHLGVQNGHDFWSHVFGSADLNQGWSWS